MRLGRDHEPAGQRRLAGARSRVPCCRRCRPSLAGPAAAATSSTAGERMSPSPGAPPDRGHRRRREEVRSHVRALRPTRRLTAPRLSGARPRLPGMKRKDGFAPIGSYAALGDGRTVALVAADGSVDFMSLPSLHAPTTFGAMLDPEQGGRFSLAPRGGFEASRRYVGRTNVLETTYRTGDGAARVTEALTLQDGGLLPWVEHARRIEGLEGSVKMAWRVEPRFDWGREPPTITQRNDVFVAEGADVQLAVHSWDAGEVEPDGDDALTGSFEIDAGQKALLVLVGAHEQPLHIPSRDHVEARL